MARGSNLLSLSRVRSPRTNHWLSSNVSVRIHLLNLLKTADQHDDKDIFVPIACVHDERSFIVCVGGGGGGGDVMLIFLKICHCLL
jgi:hypothetical protein